MKFLVSFLFIALSFQSIAAIVELPRGGKIDIDHSKWIVMENKVTPELKGMIILNKSDEKLKGFILDGTIKNAGVCKKSGGKDWLACERKQKVKNEIHHQVFIQRRMGKNSIQSYVLSFNYDSAMEKDYSKKISLLKTSLGTK